MVAGDMAEAVVDRLEAVEIDQQHRALLAARPGACFRARGQIVEQLEPVGQAGQRVVAGHMGDPVGRLAGRGDVRADAVIAGEAALLAEGRARRQLDGLGLAAATGSGEDELAEAPRAAPIVASAAAWARRALWSLRGRRLHEARRATGLPAPRSSRPIARAKRAETFWKQKLGVGLPQPVGVASFHIRAAAG